MTKGIDSVVDHFSDVAPLGPVTHNTDQFSSNLSTNNCSGSTPVVSTPCSRSLREDIEVTEVSPLSKYLVVPATSTPSGPKTAPPRARFLTSAEALAILDEKERKKQKEAEEKEQRKKEREEKKRQREEERKRKVEERARKAAEKEKEKARKAEEKYVKQKRSLGRQQKTLRRRNLV